MGHYYTEVIGTGKTEREARQNAIDTFLYEEGQRHTIRSVEKACFLKHVPPMKTIETRKGPYRSITQEPDVDAPEATWLEVWSFTLHTHY